MANLQSAHEAAARAQADEDAAVRFLSAVAGVDPNDPGGQHVTRSLAAADVRHIVRAAYRRGRAAHGW